MDDFIRAENIKIYRKALSESSDEEQRRVLLVLLGLLLAEEVARGEQAHESSSEPTTELFGHRNAAFPSAR